MTRNGPGARWLLRLLERLPAAQHPTALRVRLAVRGARALARFLLAPQTDWRAPLGPVVLGECVLVLRPPRLADARAWREQRTHERAHLEPWFAVGEDWEQAHSALAWAQQTLLLRGAARLGRARPHVALLDGRLIGQVGVDAVDWGSATGELSAWSTRTPLGTSTTRVGLALVCLDAMTGQAALRRLSAPVAVGNRAPAALLAGLGFRREAVLQGYRETAAGRTDHEIWVLHHTPDAVAHLRAVLAAEPARPAVARTSRRTRLAPPGAVPDPLVTDRAGLLLRLGLRLLAEAVRPRLRPVTDWEQPLGPFRVAGRDVVLRAPELTDGPAWVRLRRRNQARLQPWFPVHDGDWPARQDRLAWVERCVRARAAARRGEARPRVVEVDGRVRGEWGVVAVDHGTGTAELEFWLDAGAGGGGHELSRVACAAVVLDAWTCGRPASRVQVPVDPANRAAGAVLDALGFVTEGTLRAHRRTGRGPTDHAVWVLHRDAAAEARLRAVLG